jgi:2-hydroxychromene-2-carboxylate isomerase
VNFVRLDLPLDMHPQARGAARAHICAAEHDKGDAMADVLFEAEDLSEPGLVKAAEKVALDPNEFRRCLAAPETEKKLKKTESILRDAGLLQGLPTTFVGAKMLVGAQERITLRDAFETAASGSEGGVPGPLYLALFLIAAAIVVWLGRNSRVSSQAAPKPRPG